jgi:hypothetical protein
MDLSDRDRAALRRVEEIPDGDSWGDYIRKVVIEANDRGLGVDGFITIPWEWIFGAAQKLGVLPPHIYARPPQVER